jgi:hypothetical protein
MPPNGGPKLTLPPEFCGRSDELGFVFWSFKLTKYLANFPALSEPNRIAFASNLLTGQALTWFMHREKHGAAFSSLVEFLDGLKLLCNLADEPNKAEDKFAELRQASS